MLSKWYELKSKAIKMRENGNSIREVEKLLDIPRSTLSGWFKNIKLSAAQKTKLDQNWQNALGNAREKALIWHHSQKEKRLKDAENQALQVLDNIKLENKYLLEVALAMLYLGEGSKTNLTSLGNTNPLVLKFFIKSLKDLYRVDKSEIKCDLHLRSDQNSQEMVGYWSQELEIPKARFLVYKDRRLAKSETYPSYKGVCLVRCGKIALQRRLSYLGEEFCRRTINLDD